MLAPFPYFGGKRSVAADVWRRIGAPTQYIEPFCGSAAVLLAAPRPAPLERVRVVHGDWHRCLNHHYGDDDTAVFLDPPYRAYEALYGKGSPVADDVAAWARENAHLRIALCGHRGDYDLPGWDAVEWNRGRLTYAGGTTTDRECVWYSPACLPAAPRQADLFAPKETPNEAL